MPRHGVAIMPVRRTLAALLVAVVGASLLPPLPVFAAITTDSLAGYWKFDETSAGSFTDSSGDGNTGTGNGAAGTNNTPQPSTDVPSGMAFSDGRSLSFDGTDDHVRLGTGVFTDYSAYTITAWFKSDFSAGSDNYGILVADDAASPYGGFSLYVRKSDGAIGRWKNSAGGFVYSITNKASSNTWTLIAIRAVVSASGYIEVSTNGSAWESIFTGDTTDFSGLSDNAATVGAYNNGQTHFASGKIDDVRIYNRALGASEIAELAAGRHVPAYWTGTNSNYESRDSWSGSYIPDPYSRVVVRARTNNPTMTGAVQLAGLEIQTGALLRTGGRNVTMNDSGVTTLYGTLAIKGNETLSGVSVTGAKGTVLVFGSGSYTGLPTGNAVYNLTLNDGLVGYWKLDDTSGIRATDSSGWGNSGALISGPTISTTVAPTNFTNARSLSFDGSDDYVRTAAAPTLNLNNNVTIAAWVRLASGAATDGILVAGWGEDSSGKRRSLLLWSGGSGLNKVYWSGYGASANLAGTTGLATNTWYHVAVTLSANNVASVYVNGALDSSSSVTLGSYTYNGTFLGSSSQLVGDIQGEYFNGNLDDVRIYNRALSPAEIAALAAGNQPSTGLGTVTLNGALTVNGDLTLNAGTLDPSASNYGITVKGSWLNNGGKYTTRNNTVTFTGTTSGLQILSGGQRFGNVTFNGASGTWNTRDRLTASGALTITTGTLDASGSYAIHAGTWTQNGGTFTPRSGTVVLDKQSSVTFTPSSALNILRIEDPSENGLVGYWKFDEGTNSGSILDSSGFSNNGVRRGGAGLIWTGSVLPTNIAFDNPFAMKFDGTDDFVTVPNATSLNPTAAITIASWVRVSTFTDNGNLVSKANVDGSVSSPYVQYSIKLEDSASTSRKYQWNVNVGGVLKTVNSAATITAGAWTFLVGTYDGNTLRIYKDGVADANTTSAAGVLTTHSTTVRLGQWAGNGSQFYNGVLDDVRIYDRALSANEIANLARGRYANGSSSTSTFTVGTNLLSAGTLVIDSGTLNTSSPGATITSAFSLLRGNGALTLGNGTVTLNGGLTMSGSTLTGGAGTLAVTGNVSILTGSLVAPSGTLSLTGNWSKYGGTFTHNSGLVSLTGTNQTMTGSTTFNNLTKTVSAADTLTFAATALQTIVGTLTLQGAAGQLLSLRSSLTGVQWKIDAQGSRTLGSLDVRDSTNIAASAMLCLSGCVNSGNNTLWSFGGGGGTGTVLGTVWNDSDGDGIRDASESSGFSGVTLTVSGTTMSGGTFVRARTSDFAGRFAFTGATVSDTSGYTVAVDTATLPAGVIRTRFHSSGSNVLGTGGTIRVNFGYTTPSTLSGAVFVDNDADGTRDAGDTAVFSGTVLTLSGTTGTGGTLALSARSNALGIYAFRGLPTSATSFTLTVTPPSGVTTTSTDSRSIALGTGGQLKYADFGYLATPSSGTTGTTGGGGGGGGGGTRGKTVTADRVAEASARIIARYRDHQRETDRIAGPAKSRSSSSMSAGPSTTPEQRLANRQERKEKRLQLLAERARAEQILFATVEDEPILYADVRTDAWYAPYVSFVIEEGIAQGYKDEAGKPTGEFGVGNPVTYAEILKMAMEAAGKTPAAGAPRNLSARGSWAAGYVQAAEDAHYSVFVPSLDVHTPATRGAVIQTILEVLGFPIGKTPSAFSDVPKTHPYTQAIALGAFYGFVSGDTDAQGNLLNTFRPDDPMNRAEVAKLLALAAEVAGE